tara:strand:+ start:110 stop:424 length:315 start_codon:yes stop_codon:yes gene_type:complete
MFFVHFAWRNLKLAAREFSSLWVTDEDAKKLSFTQLATAILTKSKFVGQTKSLRTYLSAGLGCLMIMLVLAANFNVVLKSVYELYSGVPLKEIELLSLKDIKEP